MKQMAALTGKATPDKKVTVGPTSPGNGGPSMSFPTPSELVQKIKMDILAEARDGSRTPGSDSAPTQLITPPKNGDRLTPITQAEEGRLYTSYPRELLSPYATSLSNLLGPDGSTESGRGALFPANYKLHDHDELPFICPVRECRRLFSGLKGLGGHFAAAHCSTTYNDNGDGTLSKLGNYTKMGTGGSPGIIISRNPLPSNAPPPSQPVEQWLGAQQTRNRVTSASPAVTSDSVRDISNAKDSKTGVRRTNPTPLVTVKAYLHGFLSKDQQPWTRDDIDSLLLYPRRRDLPKAWLEHHQGTVLDSTHYACAIAYLVGFEIQGKAQCQAHTRNGARPTSRLSVPCVALPSDVGRACKLTFSGVDTCVGCKYWSHLQRRQNTCDWSGQEYKPRVTTTITTVSTSTSTSVSAAEETRKVVDVMEIDDDEPEPELESERVSEPVRRRESSKERRQRKRDFRREMRRSSVRESLVGVGTQPMQFGSADLEMEEWEVAPGSMRDQKGSESRLPCSVFSVRMLTRFRHCFLEFLPHARQACHCCRGHQL